MDGNNGLTFNTLRHALQIKGGSTTRYWVLDLHIRKVVFNYPATIVLWADGTKTVVKAGDRDVYDPEKGLAMAIAKKALGNQGGGDYYEGFKDWLPKEEESSIFLTGLFKKLDKLTEKLSKITMTKKGERMSMKEWAKREVEIACKREAPDRKEGEWDYGCACYESALKAFDSLMEDGHSGFSIGLTKQILNRLIDGKPLTPIEDTDDIWKHSFDRGDSDAKTYQCERMSSLFKDVYPDGTVKYNDVNRVVGINIDSPNAEWHMGLADKIVGEMFPITMPYIPEDKPFKVYCRDILTDPKNGDFDTVAIYYLIKPDGEKIEINRYFKEGSEENRAWTEIDIYEWAERMYLHDRRLEKLEEEQNGNSR